MHSHGASHGGDLKHDTVAIIGATLDLQEKVVSQAMTPISEVFMLSIEAKLDYELLSQIVATGHSRIPVYEDVSLPPGHPDAPSTVKKIVGILLVKQCVLLDPKDATPLRKIPLNKVPPICFLDATTHEELSAPLRLLFVASPPSLSSSGKDKGESSTIIQALRIIGSGEIQPALLKGLIRVHFDLLSFKAAMLTEMCLRNALRMQNYMPEFFSVLSRASFLKRKRGEDERRGTSSSGRDKDAGGDQKKSNTARLHSWTRQTV